MLKRGGGKQGRRYQQEPTWHFLLYKLTMQQKIGVVALKAEKMQHWIIYIYRKQ